MESRVLAIINEENLVDTRIKDLDVNFFKVVPRSSLTFEIYNKSLKLGIQSKDISNNIEGYTIIPIEKFRSIWPLWCDLGYIKLLIDYCDEKNIKMVNKDIYKQYDLLNNKILQTNFFQKNNIPFISISNIYKYKDMVVKLATGSCGDGISYISNDSLSEKERTKLLTEEIFIQQYIPYDNDYRVIVLGGKSIGIMERIPVKGEFRANISLGAKPSSVDEKSAKEVIELAEFTAKKLKCDYVGIDILRHESNLYVLETNFTPQYNGFEKIYGKQYVINKIKKYLLDI